MLRPATKVPSGRVNRFLQLGMTATRLAAGGVAEKAKRIAQRSSEVRALPHALLTAKNAEILAARLARLRGAAMKVGQMLSLEGDNMLPPEFARALEVLRSSAHQMPESQVRQVLRGELGENFLELFSHFDFEPLGTASIGQVHLARDREGREIVLKIQYPGVAESVDSDVDNLRSLLSLARLLPGELDVDALTTEIKAELSREVDYEREAKQLDRYRSLLLGEKDFLVPRPIFALCSKKILAMERAPGVELLIWAKDAPQAERDRVGTLLILLLFKEFFEIGLSQTDPNPANYFFDEGSGCLVLLDLGAARVVPPDVQDMYRRSLLGIANRDRAALRAVVGELGVDLTGDSPATDTIVRLALETAEIFRPGAYDFSSSALTQRLRAGAHDLRAYQANLRAPAPHFVFFQRKVAGTFLLCRSLQARVDCGAILRDQFFVE